MALPNPAHPSPSPETPKAPPGPPRFGGFHKAEKDVSLGGGRPGIILSITIIGACLVMIAGLWALWNKGAFSPQQVSASPSFRSTPAHESIAVSLDSARTLMKESRWAESQAVLRSAIEQFPADQDLRIALAEACLGQKKYPESYEQYEKALAIGPRDPAIEFAAGLVANTAGMTERALEHFAQASLQEPKNAGYALNLGMIQRKTGDTEAARATLLRAANLDPQNAYAWGTLADMALAENKIEIALQHVARARAIQPESRDWRLIEARAQKRKGDPERALMILLPMDLAQRREAPVARLIAECFGMLQRPRDAAAALAEAANADTTSAELAREAAECYDRAGDKTRALDFAKRAQMLGDPAAAKMVERLSKAN
jgi:tetratricopeptide (TPR) repeat protein